MICCHCAVTLTMEKEISELKSTDLSFKFALLHSLDFGYLPEASDQNVLLPHFSKETSGSPEMRLWTKVEHVCYWVPVMEGSKICNF